MRSIITTMVLMMLATSFASAYVDDVAIVSPAHTFNSGLYFDKVRTRDIVLVENPADIANRVRMFKGDLDLVFWEDPQFHPAILTDFSNFQACGRYPVRLCISLNKYGGFVVGHNDLPDQLVGYGVYDRLKVTRGRLVPTGDSRYSIVAQNMDLLGISLQAAVPTHYGDGVQLTPAIVQYPWARGYTGRFN